MKCKEDGKPGWALGENSIPGSRATQRKMAPYMSEGPWLGARPGGRVHLLSGRQPAPRVTWLSAAGLPASANPKHKQISTWAGRAGGILTGAATPGGWILVVTTGVVLLVAEPAPITPCQTPLLSTLLLMQLWGLRRASPAPKGHPAVGRQAA